MVAAEDKSSPTTHQRETTPMFTKIAIALALAFALGSTTGALAATTKKPKVAQGQSLYDLHSQVRRDTSTHDFRSRKTKTKKPAGSQGVLPRAHEATMCSPAEL